MNSEELIMNNKNVWVSALDDPNFEGNAPENSTNQRGITLIALIITIIVLLILAGVSISLLTGENSIIGKANEAKSSYNIASQNEADTVNGLIDMLSEGSNEEETPSDDPPKISNTITEQIGDDILTAPVPTGWTASEITGENTISGGLVIYEETITDWTDVNALQTTKNQYVWIPVGNINDMVMCKNNTGESKCNLVLQPNDTLVCTTPTHAGELCGRLYGVDATDDDGDSIYQTEMNFALTNQTFTDDGYREPDILTDAPYADGNIG